MLTDAGGGVEATTVLGVGVGVGAIATVLTTGATLEVAGGADETVGGLSLCVPT